jgi:hypothetical protein
MDYTLNILLDMKVNLKIYEEYTIVSIVYSFIKGCEILDEYIAKEASKVGYCC